MNETDITPIPENTPSLQRNSRPQPTIERGKIPPQDLNLEEVILGAMLIDKKGVDDVIDILNPEAKSNTSLSIRLSLSFSTNQKLSTY